MSNATPRELRLISWNVNGLRACVGKGVGYAEIAQLVARTVRRMEGENGE